MSGARIRLGDWLVAVGVAAILVVTELARQHPPSPLDPLGYALLVAGGVALTARRWAPVTVLIVTGVCGLAAQAIGFGAPLIAYLFAVFAAVRSGHRLVAIVVSVLMLAAMPFVLVAAPYGWSLPEAFAQGQDALPLAWVIAAGAAGEAVRQAERRADEAERTQEEAARRRADEERLHIARELHDSLTHQISVIKLQAEVAVHLAQKRREQVPEALLAIRDSAREADGELRATLDVLRDERDDHRHALDEIPALVAQVRNAGLDVELVVDGLRDDVPAAVGRTAYRIVQESLTNVARHAAATTATVRLGFAAGTLTIRVDDDGVARSDVPPVPGLGIAGHAGTSARSRRSASRRRRAPRVASPCSPSSRWRKRHDPRTPRRRPATHPERIPRPAQRRGRPRGGG